MKGEDFRKQAISDFFENQVTGIVTVNNWTMASDGEEYIKFFCKTWTIFTDKTIQKNGLEGFINSSERWTLAAIDEFGKVKALFPGCQVKGFFAIDKNPKPRSCFTIE